VLEIDGALHGIDRTAELNEHTITGDLENAALVLGNERLQQILSPSLERGERAGLVGLHHSALANHVGG